MAVSLVRSARAADRRVAGAGVHTWRVETTRAAALHRNEPDVIRRLLTTHGRWAVVGLSSNRARVAYGIASYLQGLGMRIVPVHPKAETVHGEQGYPSLSAVPGPIDVVDVFVNSGLA